ncbi:MAG: IS1380 family transposase, partial [Streptosporangiaceae bacterium]
MKRSKRLPPLKVTADGKGVAAHAGTRLLAEMAQDIGLVDALCDAMSPSVRRRRKHDPGQVLVDLAVSLADGGTRLSDLRILRDQPSLFGDVASKPTASRVVDSVDEDRLAAIRRARASVRARAWAAGLDPVTEHGPLILDFDATLVGSASDKEGAAPNYKHGFGFHPLNCYLDATHEALASVLRPGNAGANSAADHIAVLELALAQLPVRPLGEDPVSGVDMLVRADSAGASHAFVNALRARGIEFSIGFEIRENVRTAILELPEWAWTEAITSECEEREGAQVAELTGLLDLGAWPQGTRAIVRREEPHPGAQFNLFDPGGWRHQVFITDSVDYDLSYLEARHRGHARVEDRIRCAKDTGLRSLPFPDFANNECWVELICMAQDLIAFTQGLVLDGELASAE